MSKAVRLSDTFYNASRIHEIVQNFTSATQDGFTTAAVSGTVAVSAERGGGLSLTTQAADNAIASLTSNTAIWAAIVDKPLILETSVQYAEANTNAANLYIGLSSNAVATQMGDNGAGPAASYTGFGFYKIDGGTRWICQSSLATTKATTDLTATANLRRVAQTAGGSAYQTFGIEIIPRSAVLADIIYTIDQVAVAKHTDFVITSAALMNFMLHLKAGSSSAETAKIRYLKIAQTR